MSRLDGKISRRYIKALLDSAGADQLESLSLALGKMVEAWEESQELQAVLTSPGIPSAEKEAVVRDLAQAFMPDNKVFSNFLTLLLENRRLPNSADIHEALESFIRELKKQLSLVVTSARDIADGERENISSQVQKEYGSLASITWNVDEGLIGGLRIQAGDRLLDNSVQTSLDRLRSSLLL